MMKRSLGVMRRLLGVLGIAAFAIAACTKERVPSGDKDRVSVASTSSANVQARWDEMVPKPEEAPELPASWTDPRVVVALAERCEHRPMRFVPPNAGDLRPNRFLCQTGATPPAADAGRDLCHPYRYACEERCKGHCESCGKGCVDACTTCARPCSDAGSRGDCKRGCAATCAECNEVCTRKWESCNAEDCTKEHEACAARLATLWEKNNCASRCRTYSACVGQCSGADTGKCLAKCTTAVAPALTACLDKCAYVVSPEHEVCEVRCYETAPCAPALCRDQPVAR